MRLDERFCYEWDEVELLASYYAEEYRYIDIELWPCVNSTNNPVTCRPQDDIDEFISSSYFEVLFFHNNVDFLDYSTPLKPSIDENHFIYPNHNLFKLAELVVEKNIANFQDSVFQLSEPPEQVFYTV